MFAIKTTEGYLSDFGNHAFTLTCPKEYCTKYNSREGAALAASLHKGAVAAAEHAAWQVVPV